MNLDKIIENIDMQEQILAEWVLTRIEDLKEIDPQKALRIEERCFTDETIGYMLDHFDSLFLIELFQIITPSRIADKIGAANLEKIVAKWPEWNSREGQYATSIICKADPDATVKLLQQYCKFETRQFTLSPRWQGVMEGIALLPKAEKQIAASMLVDKCLEDDRDIKSFCELCLTDVFKLAWEAEHPQYQSLLHRIAFMSSSSDVRLYSDYLVDLLKAFGLDSHEYMMLDNLGEEDWPLDEDALNFYYDSTIPYREILQAIDALDTDSYRFIHTFFDKYQNQIKDVRIKTVLNELLNDKEGMKRIRRKRQHHYFYNMILASLMASVRKTEFDLSNVSTEQAVHLLALDMEINLAKESLTDFLKTQNKADVVRTVADVYNEIDGYYNEAHLFRLMGALQYDEFLEVLADGLEDDFDNFEMEPLSDTAEDALLNFSERAVDYLTSRCDSFENDLAQFSALTIARKVGGDRGRLFVDQYFDLFWGAEREFLLRTLEAFADEKYLERLKPFINKGQHLIDGAYLLIALLNQRQSEELASLFKQYKQERKRQVDVMGEFFSDAIPGDGLLNSESQPYIDAELECQNCHDKYVYRLDNVLISEDSTPHITQEIECLNCHKIADFKFTNMGMLKLSGELMKARHRQKQGLEEIGADGALQFISAPGKSQEMDRMPAAARTDTRQTQPYIRNKKKIGRNEPCPCGSGKKYKKCCIDK